MKKNYKEPQLQVVTIGHVQLLNASDLHEDTTKGFDESLGREMELDDWDE